MSGDWRLWANLTCRTRLMGTIAADCSRVARATTPGPPPQPHGWVRLGFEVSRFPHFWVGELGMCRVSQGCGVSGLFSSIFFSTSLNKKNNTGHRDRMDNREFRATLKGPTGLGAATTTPVLPFHFASPQELTTRQAIGPSPITTSLASDSPINRYATEWKAMMRLALRPRQGLLDRDGRPKTPCHLQSCPHDQERLLQSKIKPS